ncbi:MAG: hypothetical protein R2764_04795 [Bacteroidales bacterium]
MHEFSGVCMMIQKSGCWYTTKWILNMNSKQQLKQYCHKESNNQYVYIYYTQSAFCEILCYSALVAINDSHADSTLDPNYELWLSYYRAVPFL